MSWLIRFRNDLWRKRHGYKIVKDARGREVMGEAMSASLRRLHKSRTCYTQARSPDAGHDLRDPGGSGWRA
jgi:hypothetical protein